MRTLVTSLRPPRDRAYKDTVRTRNVSECSVLALCLVCDLCRRSVRTMFADVLMTSSPALTTVNCVVTTSSHDRTHLLTTDVDDARADDVGVDRNGPIPYPLRVAGASIGTVCLLAGVVRPRSLSTAS